MRTLHIANEKKRDASVSFEVQNKESKVEFVLPDGSSKTNVKILKQTLDESLTKLLEKYENLDNISQELIDGNPEVDIEKAGIIIENTNKLYLTKDNKIIYGVDLFEVQKDPDGTEKDRLFYSKLPSNVNIDIPIRCTGKLIPKSKIIKMFVFSRKYQIKHVNGLTYDFLYEIAKQLHESDSFMFVGAGKKGTDPLVFHDGAIPYRAFLEGRVKGEQYCLIIHLSNLELKSIN